MTDVTERLPAAAGTGMGASASLALSMFLATMGASVAAVALPTLARDLAAAIDAVQWVVTAYLGAMTVAVVLAGRLGDRFGLRRMLLVGHGLFAAASLLCAVAPDLTTLIAARSLQGAGAAFLLTLAMALVRQTVGKERIGRAMGLLGTMSAMGTAAGPALGGVMLSIGDWHGPFILLSVVALVAAALCWRHLPRAAVAPAPAGRVAEGQMLRDLAPNLIANALVAGVMMATLVVGPFYLSGVLGLTETKVGLVMSVGPALAMVSGIPSGRLVDAWGARPVMAIGVAALTAGALGLSLLPGVLGLAGYLTAIAALTPGYQLFQAANNTAVLATVADSRRGVVSGLLNLSRNLGFVTGTVLAGWSFALTDTGRAAAAPEIARSMQMVFGGGGGLLAVVLVLTLVAWRRL
ncbi:MAG: MFS transporter [Thalassobaculaceae bacterium]|nr:MFS transporter [Thalassobaculaceae bacterium]